MTFGRPFGGRMASVFTPRREALALLALALVLGASLRFYRLAHGDLGADDGASWAAASAPELRAVVETEHNLDPGKLALYDILLHGWIAVFGDGTFAMRAMSATLGTLAIVLVFAAVREVVLSFAEDPSRAPAAARAAPKASDAWAEHGERGPTGDLALLAAAFAAVLYATNAGMVTADRAVRMYPLVMVAELLEILFFVRAQRRGGLGNYVGVALCTAAMIAANFTASFLLVAEGLWLVALLAVRSTGARAGGLAILGPAAALAAGLLLLAPMMPDAVASSAAAVHAGAIDWLRRQPISWPYTTLRGAAGSHRLFWIFVLLGALGMLWNWPAERLACGFLGLWMVGPLAAVMAVTYLIRPLEFPRYVIISFVAMFALAGLGAASIRPPALRAAVAALLIFLSLRALHRSQRHPREAAWGAAAALAERQVPQGARIAAFPAFVVNVVRYYVPPARRADVVGVQGDCGSARVLILGGRGLYPPQQIARLEACYPHTVAVLHKVEVRVR
ncbi:MAG TPA: hypothetical protein VFB33_04940 [Candidatus Binataceae bacterium]|nr:hypothetical protein [Candidatus Binataceae bacterium]